MCNLYNISKGPQAILDFTRAMRSAAGNLAPGSIYPNYPAPVVRVGEHGERKLAMPQWGCPGRHQHLNDAMRYHWKSKSKTLIG